MSFFSQQAIYSLVDQFHYYLRIRYIKILVVLKYQQFEDNKSDPTEPKISKSQCMDAYNNEKRKGLDKYKGNSDKYILLFYHL